MSLIEFTQHATPPRIVAVALVLALATGCSKVHDTPSSPQLAQDERAAPAPARQLAYEHDVDIDAAPDKVATLYADGLRACHDAGAACALLESRIQSNPEAEATLKFRASPAVIPKLVNAMGQRAELARQATRAEDLSGPIADTARELAMLDDYRTRLEALRSRAANDIDALIKVNHELAEVQAKIEAANGARARLARRVDTEILNVSIRSGRQQSFWAPIGRASREFGGDLARGISMAISGVAYLLPWLVMIVIATWAVRKLWRRRRNGRQKNAG